MSAGTSNSSKASSPSGIPRSPMVGSRRTTRRPGVPASPRTARKPPIPSSRPSSSKARAKTRCNRDTPAPVIQCLRPLSTKAPSRRRSARVRMAAASLPASGSVMQMAGLSPASTSPAAKRRCASVP